MLYTRTANGTVEQVGKRLSTAAAANKFGVLGEHNLKERMAAKGVQFGAECRVLEVCNPTQAKNVLEANMAISTALPCRISVYDEGGAVKVSTLRPTAVLGLFNSPEVAEVAREVEEVIIRIIDSACD